ncbi:MAG: 4-hydroxy-tetrahydrodipicolinate reductase [Alphaproteobacteria bacterium]|nr:4-hydroxy-tetrahydrodipicolinate reductase [Alphaproteobacteria bacterium]
MIITIGICGYTGRMGQAIAEIIQSHPNTCLVGGITRSEISPPKSYEEREVLITNQPEHIISKCDVIIDFSHATATANFAQIAAEEGKPFMCGTTGLSENTQAVLKKVSATIPVLYASNTSLSLIVVKRIARLTAEILKDYDYDVSILERHHRWKKDAPSGTALTLGESVEAGNGGKHPVSYASVRSGAIVGEHEILFGGNGEYINIQHTVTDRRVFARGAVEAAMWLSKQKPGFYTMDDVLSA